MRYDTRVSAREHKRYTLTGFRGIDTANPPYEVAPYRATDMLNMISRDGSNHKRPGWKQFAHIKDDNGNELPINGYFSFKLRGKEFKLVYAGTSWYIKQDDDTFSKIEFGSEVDETRFKNRPAYMAMGDNKAFFYGFGDYLVATYEYRYFEFKSVFNDINTYIPLTTTNIECEEIEYVESETETAEETERHLVIKADRQSVRDVNVLQELRFNGLIGSDQCNQNNERTYQLDAENIKADSFYVEVITFEQGDAVSDHESEIKIDLYKHHLVLDNDNKLKESEGYPEKIQYLYKDALETAGAEPEDPDPTAWGRVDLEKGRITFRKPIAPVVPGSSNITVRFAVENPLSEEIRNARFGTLFGVSGNANVLMLAGIEGAENVDYASQAEDFTYFPSGRRTIVGTSNSAIKGYLRLGDDSLAVLKEENAYEPTLYIRTGIAASETDGIVTDGYFRDAGKIITKGAVTEHGVGMLDGDPVFLANDGLYGIVMGSDTVAGQSRVSRLRSRFITKLLSEHDLSNAVSIVYDGRYYLAIDGFVFVADSRYRFYDKADAAETFNYEWWVWNGCPIRRFFVIDGELCFGTQDGRVCKFEKRYSDLIYDEPNDASGTVEAQLGDDSDYCGIVSFSSDLDVSDNDVLEIDGIYLLITRCETVFEGSYTLNYQMYAEWKEDAEEDPDGDYLIIHSNGSYVCRLTWFDRGEKRYVLFPTIQDQQKVGKAKPVMIFKKLKTPAMFRVKADIENNGYGLYEYAPIEEESKRVYFRLYRNEDLILRKYASSPIKSYYRTGAMNFGASDYVKETSRLTIAAEQVQNGELNFGFDTRTAREVAETRGLSTFDFEDINFDKYTFDTGFASAFTRQIKRSFNYIVFHFASEKDSDMCVHELTVEYKLKRRNKGVF